MNKNVIKYFGNSHKIHGLDSLRIKLGEIGKYDKRPKICKFLF